MFLSLLGKFGAAAAFSIVFLYTAELFPTPIRLALEYLFVKKHDMQLARPIKTFKRNQAVGACSLVARIGGVLALLLDNLKVSPIFYLSFTPSFKRHPNNLLSIQILFLKVFWLPAPVFIMGVVATGKI